MARNRYSKLYVLLKVLAESEGWGMSNFARELAKVKVKKRFNIGSFTELSDEELADLESSLVILVKRGWNTRVPLDLDLKLMNSNAQPKVQITYNHRKGVDRYGKPISETSQMFNVRCDDVDEALRLYRDLKKKFYAKTSEDGRRS